MTDRLEDIAGRVERYDAAAGSDARWLVTELRETRRLGDQLADAIGQTADQHYPDNTGPPIFNALAAWRDHQKGTG